MGEIFPSPEWILLKLKPFVFEVLSKNRLEEYVLYPDIKHRTYNKNTESSHILVIQQTTPKFMDQDLNQSFQKYIH